MKAYYNENDPRAAEWLRTLMFYDLIAYGDVDTRSIEDVTPSDLKGYAQCHFFAGIGVWSYALRLAGWGDNRPVWTGSCPCQPFSAAGKGGGADDERHLWPAWFHLIEHSKPREVPIFGEQVASPAALAWLDLVCADMESQKHAVRAVDLCAAGAGAPHIRQRLYWVADADGGDASAAREQRGREQRQQPQNGGVGSALGHADGEREVPQRGILQGPQSEFDRAGEDRGLADHQVNGRGEGRRAISQRTGSRDDGHVGGLADDDDAGRIEHAQRDGEPLSGCEAPALGDDLGGRGGSGELDDVLGAGLEGHAGDGNGAAGRALTDRPTATAGAARKLGNAGLSSKARQRSHGGQVVSVPETERPRVASTWSSAEWIYCRDNKWRPVEPGSFPLAHGAPARVGRLRGYGNAIVAPLAAEFIKAYMTEEA